MKKVIILRSNPVSPDPRVEKEARALSLLGYEVVILAWDRTGELPKTTRNSDFVIHRLSAPAPYGSLKIVFSLVRFNIWLMWRLLTSRYSYIHACDLDTGFAALLITKLRRKPLVYDMFDCYIEANADLLPSFTHKFVRQLEGFVVSLASATIIVDDARREQIADMKPRKLVVVYNSPEEVPQAQVSEKNKEKLNIFYAGVLAKNRGFTYLLKALSEVKDAEVTIAGFGADEAYVMEECSRYSNITFIGKLSYQEVLEKSQQADLLFALYDPAVPNHRYSSPNKLFEAMMLGKPIIVSDKTGMSDKVEEYKNGLVVTYGSTTELTSAVEKLASVEVREKMSQNGKRAYQEVFSWKIMIDRLRELYQGLH
jgi:glycosyltransferase involved in cell wall biosynthesis